MRISDWSSDVCSSDGMERSTRHVYDNADRLRMIEDAQGGRRYRFYDAAGRLEYQVDAPGAVTRLEHGATGQLVRPTQYVNRADTETWSERASGPVTTKTPQAGGPGGALIADT